MLDRGFNEVEIRSMILRCDGMEADPAAGRFQLHAMHLGLRWKIIVEPDDQHEELIVITAWSSR